MLGPIHRLLMRGWGVVCSLLAHLFLLVVIIWTGSDKNFSISGGSPGGTYEGELGDGSYVQGLHYVQIGGANRGNAASDAGESESSVTLQSAVSTSPPVAPASASPKLEKKVPLQQEPLPENSPEKPPIVKDVVEEKGRIGSDGSKVSGGAEVAGSAKEGAGSAGSRSGSGASIGSGDSGSGSGSGSGGKGAGGSGDSPGGSGRTASNKYAARPTGVFLPPLPAPRKVQGFTLQALFEIDTLGRARLIRYNRSPDSGYNKRLVQLLKSLTFITARSVDTNRPVIDTVLVTYTF